VISFLTGLHVLACVLLIIAILMQSGKGGGLAEAFSSAENILGAQTNVVMIKVTTVLGILFLFTCVSLAILTARKAVSLMPRTAAHSTKGKTVDVDKLFDQAPSQTITLNAEAPAETAMPVSAESSRAVPAAR
jgi:preprotein translocase subunit SecG